MSEAIADLIARTGLTLAQVAVSAQVAISTVLIAKQSNKWPSQQRPRHALARVLGLTADPVTGQPLATPGIPINTVEQARAVLAQRGVDVAEEAPRA